MPEIRFLVTVGDDQIIYPPAGVSIPRGEVEVTVRTPAERAGPDADPLASTRAWLLAMAEEAEAIAPDLPADLAEHHDYYVHGKCLAARERP